MPPVETHLSHSVADTESIAATLARSLTPGACIALHGDLGAGKTQFVRGVVRGLGGSPRAVSSPTFVLLNIYDIPHGDIRKIFHLDAYRAAGPEDLESIGFTELLEQPGAITIVEWPERVETLLPTSILHVHIGPADTAEAGDRVIEIQR